MPQWVGNLSPNNKRESFSADLENMLTNIHEKKHALNWDFNAGTATMNKLGDLEYYGMGWNHPNGIANILSLYNVQKRHKTMYDSSRREGYIVHKADSTKHVFMKSKRVILLQF